MPTEHDLLEVSRRYLKALEQGVTGSQLEAFFDPDVIQEEFPNRLVEKGVRRDLPAILDAAQRGRRALARQTYEVLQAMADGNRVALEVQWVGTLAIPLGDLPMGSVLRSRFAVFLHFRDGKIVSQRNYECFDPC